MKKLLFTLLLLFSLIIPSDVFASYACTLTDDNSTDNKAALESCLTNADAEADNTMTLSSHSNYCYFSGGGTIKYDDGGMTVKP